MNAALPAVPVVDVREGGPLHHARHSATTARALRDACLGFFPRAALPLVPALDRLAQRWLARSRSPYVPEIAEIAATLGFSGVWLLNASYQWGCTALACERDGAPWLMRTLDWPFTGLGRHTELAHMRGRLRAPHIPCLFSCTGRRSFAARVPPRTSGPNPVRLRAA